VGGDVASHPLTSENSYHYKVRDFFVDKGLSARAICRIAQMSELLGHNQMCCCLITQTDVLACLPPTPNSFLEISRRFRKASSYSQTPDTLGTDMSISRTEYTLSIG
jgi:hypothetical protein